MLDPGGHLLRVQVLTAFGIGMVFTVLVNPLTLREADIQWVRNHAQCEEIDTKTES